MLGHIQRGGTPTGVRPLARHPVRPARDRRGADGDFGKMMALRGTEIVRVPLIEGTGELKLVSPRSTPRRRSSSADVRSSVQSSPEARVRGEVHDQRLVVAERQPPAAEAWTAVGQAWSSAHRLAGGERRSRVGTHPGQGPRQRGPQVEVSHQHQGPRAEPATDQVARLPVPPPDERQVGVDDGDVPSGDRSRRPGPPRFVADQRRLAGRGSAWGPRRAGEAEIPKRSRGAAQRDAVRRGDRFRHVAATHRARPSARPRTVVERPSPRRPPR